MSCSIKRSILAILALTIIIGVWCRYPYIRSGMPYFYDEDEAHHFNRIVNMVKRGEFDPKYFHKPSLHFYLRMPIVAASFLSSVKSGELRSIKEIVTSDPYGVGDYAFSASHPKIAKWNRAWSVTWSLLAIALCGYITWILTSCRLATGYAALLCALAPALVSSSAQIGVDVFVVTLALLTTLFGILAVRLVSRNNESCQCKSATPSGDTSKPSNSPLPFILASAISAGLTISTKYNAAPIIVVPIATLISIYLLRNDRAQQLNRFLSLSALVILISTLAFFAASPFILNNIPLFLDHVAYEVWHYAIAGHGEFTGEPGIGQAIYFSSWFAKVAVGYVALGLAILGAVILPFKNPKLGIILVSFPVLYFVYMCQQRVNFPRNMHVVTPFLAIYGGYLISLANKLSFKSEIKTIIPVTICLAALIQPTLEMVNSRAIAQSRGDTRLQLEGWLKSAPPLKTAASGDLQIQSSLLKSFGIERINLKSENGQALLDRGFQRLILSEGSKNTEGIKELIDSGVLKIELSISGRPTIDRIVDSPSIVVLRKARE